MTLLSLLLLAAQVSFVARPQPQQESGEPPGSLSGQVINALTGEPVKGAQVTVQCASRAGAFRQATTDRGGTFSAAGVGPGSCTIMATHRDYPGIMGLGQAAATAVVSSAQETTGVQVKLMPGGTISGRVVNDDGEPLEGCAIQVLTPRHISDLANFEPRGGAQTDDQGEYRLTGLTPDRYLVHAQCTDSLPVERLLAPASSQPEEPAESWLPVFYPNSPAAAGATMLSVLPGTDLPNVDFKMRPTPVVTVRAYVAGSAGMNVNALLIPDAATGDPASPLGGAYDQENGTVRIDFVPPGAYHLQITGSSAQPDSLIFAERRINVGTTRPQPIALQMQMAPTLKGIVEDPSGVTPNPSPMGSQIMSVPRRGPPGRRLQQPEAQQARGQIHLMPETPSNASQFRQSQVNQDGSFEVHGLGPGRYHVRYMANMGAALVDSMHLGNTRLEGETIEIGEGAPGMLRIVLGGKGARVRVHLPEDSPDEKTQWAVYFVPAGRSISGMYGGVPMLYGAGGSDLLYENLPPGKYFVLGVQQTPPNYGLNDRLFELLQARLQTEEIGPGGSVTITPKLFSSEELTRTALGYLQGESR